ncbi:hypothetical protein V6N12_017026 [Hibiscus sabdariffa]|uniref:Non-specific lipid-transfer protein n=2 Tax=Hibiscus sabdariffa TaxID=183260 RepID=A0ABR2AIB1_9ROSI
MYFSMKYLPVLLFLITSAFTETAVAPPCGDVIWAILPCDGFLNGGTSPNRRCCSGVGDLADQIKTKPDEETVCQCLQQVLPLIGYDHKRLPLIASECNVDIYFPNITHTTDCSK